MTVSVVDLGRRWLTIYRRPLGRLPLVTWRAVHIDRNQVIRGLAPSQARAVTRAREATRRADERHRADLAMTAAADRIARLIQREDMRREAS